MQNSEFVGLRIPPDLLTWIDRQAEKDRRTRSVKTRFLSLETWEYISCYTIILKGSS